MLGRVILVLSRAVFCFTRVFWRCVVLYSCCVVSARVVTRVVSCCTRVASCCLVLARVVTRVFF